MNKCGVRQLGLAAAVLWTTCHAENPVVQTCFTADPAPMVYKDTVYHYAGHDEDAAAPGMGHFKMLDWKCYTTTDMVNWTDRGTVASLATFPWADQDNGAWAPQVIKRGGKFHLYAPILMKGWPNCVIAVAVADNPLGSGRARRGSNSAFSGATLRS